MSNKASERISIVLSLLYYGCIVSMIGLVARFGWQSDLESGNKIFLSFILLALAAAPIYKFIDSILQLRHTFTGRF